MFGAGMTGLTGGVKKNGAEKRIENRGAERVDGERRRSNRDKIEREERSDFRKGRGDTREPGAATRERSNRGSQADVEGGREKADFGRREGRGSRAIDGSGGEQGGDRKP